MTNCFLPPAQSRRFLRFPAWTASVFSHCAPWRIPSASGALVEDQKPKTAVLAGGGFIGLEMAENLVEMGVSVTIVQRPKQLLAPLDTDMASFVHVEMRRHGVALRLGETVTEFRQDGDSVLTLLEESEPLRSDMVLLAIGVTPDTHLAKEAGLELGIRGSIAVNERMETSVPDIYAVAMP